jgi:short-subunit dehydrogenase
MNIFITGISKGLGLELANQYAESGHTVIGISRSAPRGIDPQITYHAFDEDATL